MAIHVHGKDELVVQFRVPAPLYEIHRINDPVFFSEILCFSYSFPGSAFGPDLIFSGIMIDGNCIDKIHHPYS